MLSSCRNAAIRKIRRVLKDDAEEPRFIQTVTAKGYRFIAALTEMESAAKEAFTTESSTVVPWSKTSHDADADAARVRALAAYDADTDIAIPEASQSRVRKVKWGFVRHLSISVKRF